MPFIPLPRPVSYEVDSPSSARLVIEPLYPGYGTTIGNVLRRALLSSLRGTAISAIKINGVDHEFTTIDHVKEDIMQLIQNIKQVRIKALTELTEPVTMKISITGEKDVTAADINAPSGVEISNKDQHIAFLTDAAAKLEMELLVTSGIGYVIADDQEREDSDTGFIDMDSIFTPIVKVGMDISNVRVGKMTNYDKLELSIETDGTRTPEEAVNEALDIILEQLNFVKSGAELESEAEAETKIGESSESNEEDEGTRDVVEE